MTASSRPSVLRESSWPGAPRCLQAPRSTQRLERRSLGLPTGPGAPRQWERRQCTSRSYLPRALPVEQRRRGLDGFCGPHGADRAEALALAGGLRRWRIDQSQWCYAAAARRVDASSSLGRAPLAHRGSPSLAHGWPTRAAERTPEYARAVSSRLVWCSTVGLAARRGCLEAGKARCPRLGCALRRSGTLCTELQRASSLSSGKPSPVVHGFPKRAGTSACVNARAAARVPDLYSWSWSQHAHRFAGHRASCGPGASTRAARGWILMPTQVTAARHQQRFRSSALPAGGRTAAVAAATRGRSTDASAAQVGTGGRN